MIPPSPVRRMIILAAGEGRRLRPLTDDRPKCLVEVAGKPLIDWQIEAASRLGIRKITVVTGHRAERLGDRGWRRRHNPDYAHTNMVETLWCAKPDFRDDVIISYGDILYEDSVLQRVIDATAAMAVVVDLGWRPYWEARFTDPLGDAESLRLDPEGRIVEIGRKASALEEIEGQYIGLMKFRQEGIEHLERVYLQLRGHGAVGPAGRPFRTMYMTDLLQAIIDAGYDVQAIPIHRQWLEIDSLSDYQLANQHARAVASGLHILL